MILFYFLLVPVLTVFGRFYGSGFFADPDSGKGQIRIRTKEPGSETLFIPQFHGFVG